MWREKSAPREMETQLEEECEKSNLSYFLSVNLFSSRYIKFKKIAFEKCEDESLRKFSQIILDFDEITNLYEKYWRGSYLKEVQVKEAGRSFWKTGHVIYRIPTLFRSCYLELNEICFVRFEVKCDSCKFKMTECWHIWVRKVSEAWVVQLWTSLSWEALS